jgi:hypothetical protein
MCAGFSYALGIEKWLYYGLFALFSTLVAYNGQRLLKAKEGKKTPWLNWVNEHSKSLWAITIVSAIAAGFCLIQIIQFKYDAILLLIFASVSSVLYVIRIGNKNAREVPFLKIHLIAFTWVFVLVLFPILNENIEADVLWMFVAHYFYVVAVTIPFDIRDLKYDDPSHKTIPQVLGVFFAKINVVVLLILFSGIMLWQEPALISNWVFHLAVLIQIGLVVFMHEKRSDFYCAGLIDGAIALLGISYFFTELV